MAPSILVASLLLYFGLTAASPILARAPVDYAPVPATCPSTQLVRQAAGLSDAESDYISKRYAKASKSLEQWLKRIDESFDVGNGAGEGGWGKWNGKQPKAPMIALTSSGGGYRAMLSGAGVIKAFDERETDIDSGVKGLYQSLTYEAGLSGGGWLLSSIAGNNYPTISSLQTNLWETALMYNVLVPQVLLSSQAASVFADVVAAVDAKQDAGFPESIIDPWGRLLSYGLLYGPEGGIDTTISEITTYSNFTSSNAPYPIITALGVNRFEGICIPQPNATQYEFHPFEFGSWDEGVDAFVSSKYLGTPFSQGSPSGNCITNFDNLGYVLGTSSNVFGSTCGPIPAANITAVSSASTAGTLAALTAPGQPGVPESAIFAPFPNPFQNFDPSPLVAAQPTLELVDGGVGVAAQGSPIWPFINRPAIDVIIVNENSANTPNNFPNGTGIRNTYNAALAAGLSRMPAIPPAETFVAQQLNQKPTFFGCNSADTATIIWIPNYNYTFNSGQPTSKLQYEVNETQGMIANGVLIANYGGKEGWPLCLACGIMAKSGGNLPGGCAQCLEEYCFN
ncbi:hypothetical protein LTR24_007298 [Lithohypha guttulata]|uniref:Lysophospholipase n=1 Tax=Lithohypha guttulata TaxID=1690604 RepID=A0ABR0K3D8_9EURO|nr:hypothetical protein LTR24_007298 [Lithohypha guttulata]